MKRKIKYKETYKPGTMRISKEFLPKLPHLVAGSKVIELELRNAGTFDDGTEFQDIRVTIQPPLEAKGRK